MSIVIFANGDLAAGDWVERYLREATALIAADGGAEHALALDRIPDVVIGDLDSITEEAVKTLREAGVEVLVQPQMKDESDLELALQLAAEKYDEEIVLLGALGGRLDQLLANVLLLNAPFLRGRPVKIVDKYQEAWIMTVGENRISGVAGDLISLLPMGGDVHIQRTSGLAWPVEDDVLVKGLSRGISNRLTVDSASVTVDRGTLLCVHLDGAWQR